MASSDGTGASTPRGAVVACLSRARAAASRRRRPPAAAARRVTHTGRAHALGVPRACRLSAVSRAQAYVTMKKKKHNQCIVVSGESGAGKTETNRQLLNYLVWRGSDSSSDNTLTQKIMDANPILEGFGNAKTTRNNNSSRFGRYALVQFNDINEVVGAQVRTFLLERSRVTSTLNANERSYHVMYQLVRGGTPHADGPAESHYYLSLSGCTEVAGMDDAAEFSDVHKALVSVGYSEEE
eukprot:378710-Prymnesium_polylepis.1